MSMNLLRRRIQGTKSNSEDSGVLTDLPVEVISSSIVSVPLPTDSSSLDALPASSIDSISPTFSSIPISQVTNLSSHSLPFLLHPYSQTLNAPSISPVVPDPLPPPIEPTISLLSPIPFSTASPIASNPLPSVLMAPSLLSPVAQTGVSTSTLPSIVSNPPSPPPVLSNLNLAPNTPPSHGEEFPHDLVPPTDFEDGLPRTRWEVFQRKSAIFFRTSLANTYQFCYDRRRSYFWWHLFVWTILMFLFSLALYMAGIPDYADCLFQAISALSATGLSTIDVSQTSLSVQIIIFAGMMLSGAVLESTYPLAMSVEVVRQKHKRQLLWDGWSEDEPPPDPPPEKKAVYLCLIVAYVYWLVVQLLFFVPLAYYYSFSTKGQQLMEDKQLNSLWFAGFMTVSSFNNAGFSLLSDSIMQLATHELSLFLISALVLLGNTAYPIALRGAFYIAHKICQRFHPKNAEAIEFILNNPRNYFTHLFGSRETWGLFWLLVIMSAGQTVLLAIFSSNDPAFSHLNSRATFTTMLFQSITRTAGLNTIDIALVRTSQQLLMIVAMYISAYPVTIFLRSSNVANDEKGRSLAAQSKRMLLDDLSWIVVPWYLICICQDTLDAGEGFIILFEVVSAYGTVGLSLGASAVFNLKSKIILTVVMLMGRHRGMPDNIDGAIDMEGVAEIQAFRREMIPPPAPPPIKDDENVESPDHFKEGSW